MENQPVAQGGSDPLESALARLEEAPLDATACFHAAVELIRNGEEERGAQYLGWSFRLDPSNILRLLSADDLEPIRQRPHVYRLLSRVRREVEWKATAGYV